MTDKNLLTASQPFLNYVVAWKSDLEPLPLEEIVGEQPERVAIISVDVINGFCYEGALASPRVAGIISPIVSLFRTSYEAGVRHFILTQDSHPQDAVEFGNFPPHCVRGTAESEAVPEFQALPFFDEFQIMPKNSLNSMIETGLPAWLAAHPDVDTFITVGDCTDLCTYQLAMHLKLRANARNEAARIILPADCVDTYDLPVHIAQEVGAIPHDGDLLHHIFLYHMMLNGVEVVASVR